MALIKCKECGKEYSDSADVCPHCGFKRPHVGRIGFIVALLFGIVVYQFVSSPATTNTPAPPKTPEQLAAEAKKEETFQTVVLALKGIRAANRNPKSVEWETIRANDDASVICVEFRGQNGFGGMNKEIVAIVNGKASQQPATWNRHCTKPLNDMIYARQAL